MRFAGDGGNYIHADASRTVAAREEEEYEPKVEDTFVAAPEEAEDPIQANRKKINNRNDNVKRLFDGLKGKFMKMFEDVEDTEI
jgi:cell division protein FtsA